MTKHILSEVQRAQILAGGTEIDLGEATPAPGASATVPATPAASAAPAPAPAAAAAAAAATPAPAPVAAAPADVVGLLTAQLSESNSALLAAKVQVANLQAAVDGTSASQEGLLKIARASVGQMQVALNSTDSTGALTAKDLVAEYERVLPVYKAKLPVGGVTKLVTDDPAPATTHPRFAERLAALQSASK